MKVQFLDLKRQYSSIHDDINNAIFKVLGQTNFILGSEVDDFERLFAEYIGTKYAVGVASGLDALKLIMRALNIKAGDEVITSANTFIATVLAISSVGAKPILIDVNEADFNINTSLIEKAINKNTKAIIPVHLYGQPAEFNPILEIGKKYNLKIIEDASQSHGATYYRQKVGNFGTASAFSLYPGKNLGAYGDAGIITTNDSELCEKLKTMRNYGSKIKYYHILKGENSRLDTIQAAILNVKIKHLDAWNIRRREVAQYYCLHLSGVGDIILPEEQKNTYHVYHQFVIRTSYRDALQKYLSESQIGTIIHYPIPIHLQEAYKELKELYSNLPVTEKLSKEILSLPIYPEIKIEELEFVISTIKSFFQKI